MPLTIVLGVADSLSVDDLDPDVRGALLTALERSKGPASGRLDVLVAATDDIDGPAEPMPVRALVGAALAELWRQRDVARVLVEGDAVWIGQRSMARALLGPLQDNALEHTPAGSGVQIAIERCDRGVAITIDDAGPGIPGAAQPFHRADHGSTREHGASGSGSTRPTGWSTGLVATRGSTAAVKARRFASG